MDRKPFIISVACAMFSLAHAQQLPQLSISSPSANNYSLSWTAANLRPYQLETSSDLVSRWVPFGNPVVGTGGQVSVSDGPVSDRRKFYRLRTGAVRPGFDQFSLNRNDDESTQLVPIGYLISLFGKSYTQCYVNNNGNVTFDRELRIYTPLPLQSSGFTIVAPFWADVDTRAGGSDIVRYSYGVETIDGNLSFGVNWINVGYFNTHDDKLNSFSNWYSYGGPILEQAISILSLITIAFCGSQAIKVAVTKVWAVLLLVPALAMELIALSNL